MSVSLGDSQVDQYYSNGLIELKQSGKHVIMKSLLDKQEKKGLKRAFADDFPERKKDVEDRVELIRNLVGELDPASLLMFSSDTQLMSFMRTGEAEADAEAKQVVEEHPPRATEYIQSLLVAKNGVIASPNGLIDGHDNAFLGKASRVLAEIEKSEVDIRNFLFSLHAVLDSELRDADLTKFVVEAQFMYMVRGKRYQSHQLEYHERLLCHHSSEFEEKFGLSADEVLNGLGNLEHALSNGKIEAWNSLAKVVSRQEEVMSEGGVPCPSQEDINAAQRSVDELFSLEYFDVARITSWPDDFVRELSYEIGECPWPSPSQGYEYWPITYLPVMRRPFIRVGGKSYCFDYYTLMDNFYRSVYWSLCNDDDTLKNAWNKSQQTASELATKDIFLEIMPSCKAFRNVYYRPIDSGKGSLSESDLLLVCDNAVFVVEVKAGSFVYTPPFIDYKAHISSYKSLLEKADHQCDRTMRYLLSYKGSKDELAPLLNSVGEQVWELDMGSIDHIFALSVTADNINEFASRAERLSFLQLRCGAISIALDDLMVYRDYFDNPDSFIEYLRMRCKASRDERLALDDEVDHLGMYAEFGDYAAYADSLPENAVLNFIGFRDDFDEFYGKLGPNRPARSDLRFFIGSKKVKRYIDDHGKLGRNDLCPCGSGKKYKRCHGRYPVM